MPLSQAQYFAPDPYLTQEDYARYLDYMKNPTSVGDSGFKITSDPNFLPPGFLQSGYAPNYNSVLQNYTGHYLENKDEDPSGYGQLLRNWIQSYAGGRSMEDWQNEAAKSAQGTPLIGGGQHALDAPTVGQLALGGFGGAAMGAGVGSTAGTADVAGTGVAGGAGGVDAGVGTGAVGGAGAASGGAAAAPTLGQVGGVLSGGAAAVNALNGGGSPAQGGAAQGGANTGGILGALLGGALGGMQGGNRPAGTTTTTTNQTLAPGGLQNLQDTIAGNYLNPASNPYLSQTYDAAARQITPRVNSLFEASGRYGSGAHQGVLGQSLADLGTSIYGGNYNNERARQLAAAGTPIGNTVQNPYFTNPLGGILSGALAGGVLGGGTGFLGGANGGILNGIGGALGGIGNIFGNGGSGGTSDQTNNWNPSMPLPDYYSGGNSGGGANFSPMPATYQSPASFAYNPASYDNTDYTSIKARQPTPTSIDQFTRTPM